MRWWKTFEEQTWTGLLLSLLPYRYFTLFNPKYHLSDSNFFFCMLMFKKSPWLSMGTIIRYPQREIEKLIILSVLYFSGPLEMALRAVASPPSPSKHNHNPSAARDQLLVQ